MKVDFFSTNYAPPELKKIWVDTFQRVVDDGVFIGGKYVESFEREWANYVGSKYAVGVSNGLDGLILALRAVGITSGKRVAVPAHTFIATWNAILSVGAIPIGVDVDEDGLLDIEEIESIVPEIDAVLPVHMHGATVDMKSLFEICKRSTRRITIIEDASQAHGALTQSGDVLGKFSDCVVYSLYPTKNLGALGDAAIVTSNELWIDEKIRVLRNYGSDKENKYIHRELGFNNRLDPLQAAILSRNLEFLTMWNLQRQELSSIYLEELSSHFQFLQSKRTDSVRHHICILHEKRDELREYLSSKGISTEIHYPRVAGIEADTFSGKARNYQNAESIAKRILSLPLSQWHSVEQISYVIEQLKNWPKL